MSRRQLPPQIRKVTVTDRATAKTVVRYQVTVDAGSDPVTGRRRQVRRRFDTERAARSRVQAGAGSVVENEPKTLSSCRTLPLDEGLVAVLKRASVRYAQDRLALGAAHADSGYVAVNEAGEPVDARHAHEDVAQAGRVSQCATDPAARRPPLLRDLAAPPRCADGRHREVARQRRRGDLGTPDGVPCRTSVN